MSSQATTRNRRGVVLLVTLVVLLVLTTLAYNLVSRVAAQRHRNNYIIDYTVACYARDSAIKYALAILEEDLNDIQFVSRPNEPDFSDLFALAEPDYRRLLEQWAEELVRRGELSDDANQPDLVLQDLEDFEADANINELLDSDEDTDAAGGLDKLIAGEYATETNVIDLVKIRGPYGPPWPFVTEPVEFEIGPAKVKIEIEDENAKYPAGWAVLDDKDAQRGSQAGLDTFCEWMGFDANQINPLKEQLQQVGSIRPFKVDFQSITRKTAIVTAARSTRDQRRGARRRRTTYRMTTISPAEQLTKQVRDFSKLFHSGLVDTEILATPTIVSEYRKESALKYMDLWGATQVNINSAPRQVLEAAFTFGGDAEQIASEIIKRRRETPFAGIEELKQELFRFADSIDKSKPYITTSSNIFAVRVTAASGVAKASAVIVVLKEGDKIERIAVVRG